MIDKPEVTTNLPEYASDCTSNFCSDRKAHHPHPPGSKIGASLEVANRALQEHSLTKSHGASAQQPKAIINHLSNLHKLTSTRSIASLPTEILSWIFEVVCNVFPCPLSPIPIYGSSYRPPVFPTDPVVLSHVCSLWRHITVNSGSLWSHIDLNPKLFQVPRHFERANTYMTRSGSTLLDIHIIDPSEAYLTGAGLAMPQAKPRFLKFLTTIAPRIRSLAMRINHPPTQGGCCHSIISTCFANCVPGRLFYLSLDVTRDTHTYPRSNLDTSLVGVSKATVETLWHPVKVLRLRKFFPIWTSKAYHGLVDLHLIGESQEMSIPESKLVTILRSSPGLRVFKTNFEITRSKDSCTPIQPVPLVDLEQLSATCRWEPQRGRLLRLVAPGTRPLSLTVANLWLSGTTSRRRGVQLIPSSCEATKSFLARSHVVRIYACSFDNYQQLADLLSMAPSARVLVVDGCRCDQIDEKGAPSPEFTLDELYVIRSTNVSAFTWSSIEQMVEKHRIQKLTLWWYDHRYNGLGEKGAVRIPDNLYTVCPVVKVFTKADPNPIEDWE